MMWSRSHSPGPQNRLTQYFEQLDRATPAFEQLNLRSSSKESSTNSVTNLTKRFASDGHFDSIGELADLIVDREEYDTGRALLHQAGCALASVLSEDSTVLFLKQVADWKENARQILVAEMIEARQLEPITHRPIAEELIKLVCAHPLTRVAGAAGAWLGASATPDDGGGEIAQAAIRESANRLHTAITAMWDPATHLATRVRTNSVHPCVTLARIVVENCSEPRTSDIYRCLMITQRPCSPGILLLGALTQSIDKVLCRERFSESQLEATKKLLNDPGIGPILERQFGSNHYAPPESGV
jgi:hypothetical protein